MNERVLRLMPGDAERFRETFGALHRGPNVACGKSVRTLKEGDAFAVLDSHGDCGTIPDSPEGLFFRDTRYLSRFRVRFAGRRPLLLGSVIQDDNAALRST